MEQRRRGEPSHRRGTGHSFCGEYRQFMIRFVLMIGIVVAVLGGVLALPIQVPYTISTMGKVLPAAEWVLVRDQGGSIGTLLRDNLTGTIRSSDVHQFERGDAVRYRLNPVLHAQTHVAEGDTVLQIESSETARQLAALTGEAAAARSEVALYASGEKASVVEAAERRLARAVEQARQQKRSVERLKALRERQLVAEQELEVAASQLEIFQAEAEMARAELNVVRTGSKQERVNFAETAAEARVQEMRALSERLAMQTIRAPLSGIAVRSFGSDTLLTIRDTSAAVVVMPVTWNDLVALKINQTVRLNIQNGSGEVRGRIVEIGDSIQRLGREQVVMVTARLEHMPKQRVTGGVVACRIETDPVRLFEFVRRSVL